MVSIFIKQITEQELQKQTSYKKNDLFINFENNQFKKGLTFSLTMQDQAINYCQRLVAKSLSILLVKEKYSFTVWVQEKNIESQETKLKSALSVANLELVTENTNFQEEVKTASTPQLTHQQVPTKKVTKVYRGQTYEAEIPDYSTIQSLEQNQQDTDKDIELNNAHTPQLTHQQVPTKKVTKVYRGQTYEVEIPDYSIASPEILDRPKPRRKYRGQYID
jgi:hypothetical protein